jgi:hypothetical protein
VLNFIATPTQSGAVVCHYSPTLNAHVVDLDCRTMREAVRQAALRNLDAVRDAAFWARESSARTTRQAARWFETEAVQ